MKKINNWSLTILGIIGAIGNAVININWIDFHFQKEWPKLLASVVVAVVGYLSSFNTKKEVKDDSAPNQ